MRVNELIDALYKYQGKEVVIQVDDGLFCTLTNVELYDGTIVLKGKTPIISAESSDFDPLDFNNIAEKIFIVEQK